MALQREAEEAGLPPPGPEAAFTYELCAGLVDKSSSLQQIAAEEVRPQYMSPPTSSTSTHLPLSLCMCVYKCFRVHK